MVYGQNSTVGTISMILHRLFEVYLPVAAVVSALPDAVIRARLSHRGDTNFSNDESLVPNVGAAERQNWISSLAASSVRPLIRGKTGLSGRNRSRVYMATKHGGGGVQMQVAMGALGDMSNVAPILSQPSDHIADQAEDNDLIGLRAAISLDALRKNVRPAIASKSAKAKDFMNAFEPSLAQKMIKSHGFQPSTVAVVLGASIGTILTILLVFAVISAYQYMRNREAVRKAKIKLFDDASRVLRQIRGNGKWQGMLDSFSTIRGERHMAIPNDIAFNKCVEQSAVQNQILALFMELSSGDQLLQQNEIKNLWPNFWMTERDIKKGDAQVLPPMLPDEYKWLTENIEKPVEKHEFVAVFVLLTKVRTDLHRIEQNGNGSTAIGVAELVDGFEINAWVQLGESVPYHVRYGWQQQDGVNVYFGEACQDDFDARTSLRSF